jgi:hypothetical protein
MKREILNEVLFVVVAKLFGESREIIGLKVNHKGEVFLFLLYARLQEYPFDLHMSKHLSGERHLRIGLQTLSGYVKQPTPKTKIQLQPLSNFVGSELLVHIPVPRGQFVKSVPPHSNRGEIISWDLDSAQFRDDMFFVRVHLVEPTKEDRIPVPINMGPHVVHFIRSTTSWIAVELFQERPA